MARNYSIRSFLRHAPNHLVGRYFRDQGLLLDLDFAALSEVEVEPVVEAFEKLAPEIRATIDADFQLMELVTDEDGVRTLIEEGRFHGEDLEPLFAQLDGFHDRVLLVFLSHPQWVSVAAGFREADQRPDRYWLRRKEGVPVIAPRDHADAREELADAVGQYFQHAEGRGYCCAVEAYRRGERYYFFCFPEDYGQTQIEYEKGAFCRRPRHPAFEVIFVYDPTEAALDTFHRGRKKTAEELQQVFGRIVLDNELPALAKDERVYELNCFKDREFAFIYDRSSGIEDVRLKELRLTVLGEPKRRITIEVDSSLNPNAVHDLLEKVVETKRSPAADPSSRVPLALTNVTKVALKVRFRKDKGRAGTRTFSLTYPNGCNLKQEGRDLLLRQMLLDSGIEPRTLTPEPA